MPRPADRKRNVYPPAPHEAGHGREAEEPHEVPHRGWLDILVRTKRQIASDNLSIVAAGVAFYAFVAVTPALAALIGIYGLISDPGQVRDQVNALAGVVPREILPVLEDQLSRITANAEVASLSAIVGVLVALYSSAKATKAVIQGLNIAYGEEEKRGFFRLNAIALLLTACAIAAGVIALALVAVLPALLENLSLGPALDQVLNWARWPLLVVGFTAMLAVLYRYAPSRDEARWAWVSWGAVVASLLWIAGSAGFSVYVSRFGSYDKTYGSLGAIVVFLLWTYLSAYVVLLGAELNAEMERQTVKDTTEGAPRPLGQRGAFAADTVGPARHEGSGETKTRPPPKRRRETD
ncbi:YihY/virulence factor BrkB family protein [Opitutus sp. ER46]|uniref:YihY/virulence factor BrkB family protein n=1 Tax=Opitutus sp. ER46 TaxID=2161864 RepID=UPI000D310F90|nr:YihY/virulence factor BrkB family protein [Opitutus sp. ER46]PTX97838.1 hypothetical protein DB354_06050 [Opitutus sp. ER46]